MAKRAITTDRVSRRSKATGEEARFEAWLRDFDARLADLRTRQEEFLRSLGIEPVRSRASEQEFAESMAIPVLGGLWQLARRVEGLFENVENLMRGLQGLRDELRELDKRVSTSREPRGVARREGAVGCRSCGQQRRNT